MEEMLRLQPKIQEPRLKILTMMVWRWINTNLNFFLTNCWSLYFFFGGVWLNMKSEVVVAFFVRNAKLTLRLSSWHLAIRSLENQNFKIKKAESHRTSRISGNTGNITLFTFYAFLVFLILGVAVGVIVKNWGFLILRGSPEALYPVNFTLPSWL